MKNAAYRSEYELTKDMPYLAGKLWNIFNEYIEVPL